MKEREPKTQTRTKGARSYSRHGLTALKARVMVRGLAAVDQRMAGAQALLAWRKQLLSDLGGEETVSAQELALVDLAARTGLFIDHLDAFLLEQPSLINRRKKAVLPVVRERQALVDSLARILSQLGLQRRTKPVMELSEYLARKAEEKAALNGDEPRADQEDPRDFNDNKFDVQRENEAIKE